MSVMAQERVDAIFEEIDTLAVDLSYTPELGPAYFHQKMVECRQKQNVVFHLLTEVSRALSGIRQAKRALSEAVAAGGKAGSAQTGYYRERLAETGDEVEALRYLKSACDVCRANLTRTATDIRSLLAIVTEAVKNQAEEATPRPKVKPAVAVEESVPLVDEDPDFFERETVATVAASGDEADILSFLEYGN